MRFTRKARIASLIAASLLVTGAATSANASVDLNNAAPSVTAKAPAGATRIGHTVAATVNRDVILADYTSGYTSWGYNAQMGNTYAADHFEVPAGHTWKITSMVAPGFWWFGNPGAIPIQLRIYTNKSARGFHSPGRQIAEYDTYSSPSSSDFTFNLGDRPLDLKAGTYWFSVISSSGIDYYWYHYQRSVPGLVPTVIAPISRPQSWRYNEYLNDEGGHNLMIVIGGTDKY